MSVKGHQTNNYPDFILHVHVYIDMAIQNVIGDSFRGATWVAIHNGGGVGWYEGGLFQLLTMPVNNCYDYDV